MAGVMKVSKLKDGMLLTVSAPDYYPITRNKEPDRLTFFPDIFAQAGFGNIRVLNHKSYYLYLGKRRELVPGEYTNIGNSRTRSHHEVMDTHGYVYKVHGREFKNFEPVWREDDSTNSDN
jgi:hypothetical protein